MFLANGIIRLWKWLETPTPPPATPAWIAESNDSEFFGDQLRRLGESLGRELTRSQAQARNTQLFAHHVGDQLVEGPAVGEYKGRGGFVPVEFETLDARGDPDLPDR